MQKAIYEGSSSEFDSSFYFCDVILVFHAIFSGISDFASHSMIEN